MSDEDNNNGDTTGLTYPKQAGQIRKGEYVLLKGKPCKVMDVSTSKTGKHGHAKCNFMGIDIFTGKKYEDMTPSTHNMDCPHVARADFALISIDERYLNVFDDKNEEKSVMFDPESEIGLQIIKDNQDGKDLLITVISAMVYFFNNNYRVKKWLFQ
jgi:translation initiation factor 5A